MSSNKSLKFSSVFYVNMYPVFLPNSNVLRLFNGKFNYLTFEKARAPASIINLFCEG